MNRLLRGIGSIPFFLAVLGILIGVSAAATLLPAPGVFRSPLFLFLGALLELSLLLCVVPRSIRRIRKRNLSGVSWAADLIHLGLFVVIAAGVLSPALSEREVAALSPGETAVFRGTEILLTESQEVRDENGNVTDWRLELETSSGRQTLSVNDPLTLGLVRVHLFDWQEEDYILLVADDGSAYRVREGEGLEAPDGRRFVFADIGGDQSADFTVTLPGPRRDGGEGRTLTLRPGDRLAGLEYRPGGRATTVVLQFSYSPLRWPIMLGLLFLLSGLILYVLMIRKRHG